MEERIWKVAYYVADYENACNDEDRQLLIEADIAREGAHAPYSRFTVGAALLLDDNTTLHGSNQENASFPLGLCAERTALSAKASLAPKKKVKAIAIRVKSDLKEIAQPAAPCGICRQVLLETEIKQHQDIRILLQGEKGKVLIFKSVKDLLPFYFGTDDF
jgi:cytidine deaminase